jgi:hypothetical protein
LLYYLLLSLLLTRTKLQDLKPLNVMKVGEIWKLIDLDAAVKIGEKAGLKSSTGYAPPELLILSISGEASVRDPSQVDHIDALTADSSFDMWSLGVLLYLLVTGQTLFNNNQEDNLDADDLLKLAKWDQKQLKAALRKVHTSRRPNPLANDLLGKLLQPKPKDRPNDCEEVLDHPFFVGESDGSDHASAKIIEHLRLQDVRAEAMHEEQLKAHRLTHAAQERHEKLLKAVDTRTTIIESISNQTMLQLFKTEQVLLRGMFEATEVMIPTSFLITPNKLEQPTGSEPLLQLAEDGSGIELGAGGEKVKGKLKEQIEQSKGWFNKVCNLGSSVCEAVRGKGVGGIIVIAKQEVSDFVKNELQDEPMYLYLIDEYTGNPVPPSGGDGGRYPIEITKPSENAVKLLPLMRAGLKVMSVVNGAAFVGNMFALPIPHVPKAWQEQVNAAVGNLDKKSSVAEFDALQQSVDASIEAEDGEDKKQAVRGTALREFERFLDEHDPDHTFANLNRLVTLDGQACWTELTQSELVEAEEKRNQVCFCQIDIRKAPLLTKSLLCTPYLQVCQSPMTPDMTQAIPPAVTSRRFPTFDPSSKEDVDAALYAYQFAEVTATAKAVAAAVATKEAEMEAAVSTAVAAGVEAALAEKKAAVSTAVAAGVEAALAEKEAAVSTAVAAGVEAALAEKEAAVSAAVAAGKEAALAEKDAEEKRNQVCLRGFSACKNNG